jgi:WD40 domain-containing protein
VTIEPGKLTDGNPRGVYSPPQDDPDVLLFENEVDLGPATLKRQMIRTRDRAGRALHGLREIFTAKPEPGRKRMFHLNRAQVNGFLVALILLDVFLSATAIGFPERWCATFHGLPYDDPAGLLRRTGAVWVAFTLLQAIALVRWQHQPYWLVLIAGVRFTELFSDWVTIFAARQMTAMGTVGLLFSPPGNLLFGLILISTYMRLKSGPISTGSFDVQSGGVPWSPDSTRLVTASEDKTAQVWDTVSGRPVTPPLDHQGWVTAVASSPADTRAATASNDLTARVWDAVSG